MISPHTPPGTGLVVVWTTDETEELVTVIKFSLREIARLVLGSQDKLLNPIRIGQRVVLDEIIPVSIFIDEFGATLVGREGLYPLKCFDIAVLPSALTDALTSTPVPEDA